MGWRYLLVTHTGYKLFSQKPKIMLCCIFADLVIFRKITRRNPIIHRNHLIHNKHTSAISQHLKSAVPLRSITRNSWLKSTLRRTCFHWFTLIVLSIKCVNWSHPFPVCGRTGKYSGANWSSFIRTQRASGLNPRASGSPWLSFWRQSSRNSEKEAHG